jgi:uncharacterized protein (TIGR00369 family)
LKKAGTMTRPDARAIQDYILKAFPTPDGEPEIVIEEVSASAARLRMPAKSWHLRPGATVSGPTQMALADSAAWCLLMHNLGFSAASSVTSNLNMSFLSRPASVDLIAHAQLLKLGKRLSVSEVRLHSEGHEQPVAHATVTYAVIFAKEGGP